MKKTFTREELDKRDKLLALMKKNEALKIKIEALKQEIIDGLLESDEGEVGSYKIKWEQDFFTTSYKTYKLVMYDLYKNLKICYISDNWKEIHKYIVDNLDNLLARSNNEKLNSIDKL